MLDNNIRKYIKNVTVVIVLAAVYQNRTFIQDIELHNMAKLLRNFKACWLTYF